MSDKPERGQSEKGLSAGVLAVVFLIWAGICAVFFSLGFLVGYNEQSSKLASLTERVAEPSAVPPLVSSLHRSSDSRTKESKVFSPPPSGGSEDSAESVSQASPPAALASAAADQDSETQSVTPSASQGQKLREVGMGYTVQVDALRAKGDAEVIVKILKERHYPVFLVAPEYSNTRDNLYRVQVGPFASRDDADKVRAKLAKEGFKPFVRR